MRSANALGELGSYTSPLTLGGDSLADLLDLAAPPAWMKEALCAQVDPALWFPEKGGSNKTARAICQQCPVRAECLEYSLSLEDNPWGIWGGTSMRDRYELRRARRHAQEEAA